MKKLLNKIRNWLIYKLGGFNADEMLEMHRIIDNRNKEIAELKGEKYEPVIDLEKYAPKVQEQPIPYQVIEAEVYADIDEIKKYEWMDKYCRKQVVAKLAEQLNPYIVYYKMPDGFRRYKARMYIANDTVPVVKEEVKDD